jgi:hypothetical protein
MDEIIINDSRTKVTGVKLTPTGSTGAESTDRFIQYRMRGDSSYIGNSSSGDTYIAGTLKKIDKDYFSVGKRTGSKDVVYFVITAHGIEDALPYRTEQDRGFTHQPLSGAGSTDEEDDEPRFQRSRSRSANYSSSSKENSRGSSGEEGFCKKFIFTIIPILPIWWIIKVPFSIIFYPFRKICSSSKSATWLPHYSFKKF